MSCLHSDRSSMRTTILRVLLLLRTRRRLHRPTWVTPWTVNLTSVLIQNLVGTTMNNTILNLLPHNPRPPHLSPYLVSKFKRKKIFRARDFNQVRNRTMFTQNNIVKYMRLYVSDIRIICFIRFIFLKLGNFQNNVYNNRKYKKLPNSLLLRYYIKRFSLIFYEFFFMLQSMRLSVKCLWRRFGF